ncbi:polypyrimidine tract-binding protein homolog 3 [Tanacetum coccineum]
MASGGSDQNAEYALSKLLQMGTVAEYESKFVILANRVSGISSNLLKSFYISRLKLELQRELFRSRPTNLGQAFPLARIVEARFEDERPIIAIAKPNELTSNVHVQDLEQTTQGRGDEPNRIQLVTIHHMTYPIIVEVLNQIFSPHGYVEKVIIFQKIAHVQALIQFQSRQNAIVARNSLQGCNIYKGCCQLDIQFSNLEELQENQEEHIFYYYWEHCFLILNAEEAGNTKSPLSADTIGNSGVDEYGIGSEVLTGLLEEFQGDMVDALSRVLEQKSSERGLISVVRDETTHFLEPHYSPFSILVLVILIIEEYGIPESISLLDNTLRTRLKLELQWELFRSRPTTLGQAFSLARIVEARFEDERPIIAIAKPNELTSNVHIQDLKQTTRGRRDDPNCILTVTIHHMIYPITVKVLNQIFSPHGYGTRSEVVTGLPKEFQGDMVDALSRVLEQKVQKRGLISVAGDETTHFLEPYYLPFSILVPVILLIEEYEIPKLISLQDNTLRTRWL